MDSVEGSGFALLKRLASNGALGEFQCRMVAKKSETLTRRGMGMGIATAWPMSRAATAVKTNLRTENMACANEWLMQKIGKLSERPMNRASVQPFRLRSHSGLGEKRRIWRVVST